MGRGGPTPAAGSRHRGDPARRHRARGRPAVVPGAAARLVLVELARQDVQNGGVWQSEPTVWSRYDRPWHGADNPAGAELVGSLQVAYGTPTKYEITIYRVTVTRFGLDNGWSVESL